MFSSFIKYLFGLIICLLFISPVLATPTSLGLLARTQVASPDVNFKGKSQAWLENKNAINVAVWGDSHPPLYMGYDKNVLEGISADYLGLLSQTFNKKINVLHFDNIEAAHSALENQDVDMLAFYNPSISKYNDLIISRPYLLDHAVIVYKNTAVQSRINTLENRTLAFVGDDYLRQLLSQNYPAAQLKNHLYFSEAMAALAYNTVDALWMNASTASFMMSKGIETQAKVALSDLAANANISFAALEDNAPLIDAINSMLTALPLASRMRITNNWGLDSSFVMQHNPLSLTREELAWIAKNPQVPVSFPAFMAPVSFLDKANQPNGYVVSLLKRISERTGIQFTPYTFSTAPSSTNNALLKKGVIAAVIKDAVPLPGIDFSRSYVVSPRVLVVDDRATDLSSLETMSGKRVAVVRESGIVAELALRYPNVKFVEADNVSQAFTLLSNKKVEGAITAQISADYLINKQFYKQLFIANAVDIAPAHITMSVNSENAILLNIINKALIDLPPQTLQRDLTPWQNYQAPPQVTVWDKYSNLFFYVIVFTLAITLTIVWRNRYLNKIIDERTRHEQQLKKAKNVADRANASKSIFLSQMSHEIRTPLNALIGLLELETRKPSPPEQREQNIAVAWGASKSLLSLVGDILDLAKIESGVHNIRYAPLSLAESVQSVVTLFTHTATAKNIELKAHCDLKQPVVLFDSTLLNQILSNLVSNAIKFTELGRVEVIISEAATLTPERREYVLKVSDTGTGLNEYQKQAIFEPFVQVEDAVRNPQGTGLGLSICRQLAERLGGSLSVESEPGSGSTFSFHFSADIAHEKTIVRETASPDKNTGQKHILIVDDHATNRLVLSQQLEYAGHHVIAVESAQQALLRWETATPAFDIVITDCNMPGMSGFELVTALREKERQRGLAESLMFGLTALAETEARMRGKQAGMTDCLFKPLPLDTLLTHVSSGPLPRQAA